MGDSKRDTGEKNSLLDSVGEDEGATRLLHPWDFPGKNTGVGSHFLLQGIFPRQVLNPVFHITGRFFTI